MRKDDISLDNCLKCADCNTACPMVTAHPAYPGPKRLGPELERMRREGIECDTDWLEYCLGCHRCDLACPNEVNVSELIARAKATHKKTPVRKMRDWWFARPALLGKLMTIAPGISNFALGLHPVRGAMSGIMKITPERSFPSYTKSSVSTPAAATAKQGERVVFFPGCYIQYNEPELGCHVLQLLQLNGFKPEVASTGCCGVPALANGDAVEARKRAEANVNSMVEAVDAGAKSLPPAPAVDTCSRPVLPTCWRAMPSCRRRLKDLRQHLRSGRTAGGSAGRGQAEHQLRAGSYQAEARLSRAVPSEVAGHGASVVQPAAAGSRS